MHEFAFLRRGLLSALLIMSMLGAVTMLSACNTTAGIGQDVSATGNAVTNSAEKVKQGL
jgi:predicted small secreted protein